MISSSLKQFNFSNFVVFCSTNVEVDFTSIESNIITSDLSKTIKQNEIVTIACQQLNDNGVEWVKIYCHAAWILDVYVGVWNK